MNGAAALLAIAVALLGFALVAAGWGIYLVATEDVQGGRDAAGAFSLAVAVAAAVLAWLAFRVARRRTP